MKCSKPVVFMSRTPRNNMYLSTADTHLKIFCSGDPHKRGFGLLKKRKEKGKDSTLLYG